MRIIYYIIIRTYIVWSRLYRFFERKTKNYTDFKIKMFFAFLELNFNNKWQKVLSLIHYENDKPYHLWDVTSDPYYALKRGWGDCDDYSAIAYTVFGDEFINNKKYNYVGTFYILYNFGGHVISIWKSSKDYFYISTQSKGTYTNVKNIIAMFDQKKKINAVAWVKANNKKGFYDITFSKLYMRKNLDKLYKDVTNGC